MNPSALALRLLPVCVAFTAFAAEDTWKGKEIAAWSDDEAKQILSDSPWSKTTTPTVKARQQSANSRPGGMGGQRGGMGGGYPGGGIGGIGFPGGGMGGRRGGMGGGGYPRGGGGYPGGQQSGQQGSTSTNGTPAEAPKLTLRWETALTVRAAEMKTHDMTPATDDKHYTLAIYGVPERLLSGDHTKLAEQIKKVTVLKRDGKKDVKASSVDIIDRPEGTVVLCEFPISAELSEKDRRIEFDSEVVRLQVVQSFYTEDMVWQGKLQI